MVGESSAINLMILLFKVVTDIIHNVVIIFQATILLVTILVLARVFQPLPCFAVSLFSGSWQFLLLLLMGYWNCIFHCSALYNIAMDLHTRMGREKGSSF